MKVIKASTVKPNDTGYVCYLTLTEARVLSELCRRVISGTNSATGTSQRITRKMINQLTDAGCAAPITYFTGVLGPVVLEVQNDE